MDAWLLLAGAGAAAALVPLFLFVLLQNDDGSRSRRLPPGPPAVPMLGNLLWLRHSTAYLEPLLLQLFEQYGYGPIVTLRIGSRLSIFVADRHLAHAALVSGGAALADRPRGAASVLGIGDTIISRADYGHVWRRLRRNLVSETLHPSRVFALAHASVRRVLLHKLREAAAVAGEDGGGGDVVPAFQYSMFCLLVLMCFGERLQEPLLRAIEDTERAWLLGVQRKLSVFFLLPSVTKRLFRRRLRDWLALRRRQMELFVPLINARREYMRQVKEEGHPPPTRETTTLQHSYVDTLLDITLPDEEGSHRRRLTDDEIVTLCSEFLGAGADTTSTGLQWIMAELVKNPAIQEKLYDDINKAMATRDGDGDSAGDGEVSEEAIHDMPYLKAVILEGLPKHPPGHFVLPHKAAEDMDVGGYMIPKGATVNFMVAVMGRDDKEWDKPMEFMPERFLEGGDGVGVDVTGTKGIRMMPFGVGCRICAGMSIGMLHLEYFVANMVKEFEWKEVLGDEVDFAEKPEFTTVMKKPLRARLVPRK